jgi:hypothetical protein
VSLFNERLTFQGKYGTIERNDIKANFCFHSDYKMKPFFFLLFRVITVFPILFFMACKNTDSKYGMVEMFHGSPKPVRMVPRAVLGDLPSGPFLSQKIQGILLMDTGCDYEGESSFTYLTNLLERYVTSSRLGDLPFHYFIDTDGRVFAGRQEITAAELHEGDSFTLRPEDVDKKQQLYARMAAKRAPLMKLEGYVVVALLGNYNKTLVNEKQEKSLFQLLANIVEDHNIAYENIKLLKSIYPETKNPGFYLENYINPTTLKTNIPPAPGQHRFFEQESR